MRFLNPLLDLDSESWVDVEAPDAAFSWVPFTIERNGRTFRPKDFDLQEYADISVSKTYYVDSVNGSDGNTGLSWAAAYKTFSKALGKADVDRIEIAENSYFYYSQRSHAFSRDVEIIGYGSGDSRPKITGDLNNVLSGAWSLDSNHYENTVTLSYNVGRVFDALNDEYLTKVNSEAEVEATAGTFYFTFTAPNSPIYVRTSDDREPDSDIILLSNSTMYASEDSRKVYFKNLIFFDNVYFFNDSSTGGFKLYFEDCDTSNMNANGISELIAQSCTGNGYGDCYNYKALNSVLTKAIEIDCNFRNRKLGSTNQASTGHDDSFIVRINGTYHDTGGHVIADTADGPDDGMSWCLGCVFRDSDTNVSVYSELSKMWLDRCTSQNNTTDIQVAAGCTVYTRLFITDGSNGGAGTVTTY